MDYDIFAATSMYIEERREERMDQADPNSARVGSRREQKDLIQDQHSRAKHAASMDQAGQNAPSPSGQMQKLDQVLEQRTAGDADGR